MPSIGICGATAIAATGPTIEAKEEEMGMAVACVTLFGLVAMFLYPFLFANTIVGQWLHHSQLVAGVWCGTAIHETAQVVGVAQQIGGKALAMGLVTKSPASAPRCSSRASPGSASRRSPPASRWRS